MPINSPGTLTFAPRGFEFQCSLSSTNPQINGVETFNWDPRFHGFSGDMAISSILTGIGAAPASTLLIYNGWSSWVYTPAVTTTGKEQPARTCVFPAPLVTPDPAIPGQTLANGGLPGGMQSLGVIVQFRYCPADGNGVDQVTVPNFNNQTAVYPNTPVEVDVVIDPHAVYRAQTYTPWGYSSVLTNNAFMFIGGFDTYQVTLPVTTPLINAANPPTAPVNITLTFPLGKFTGPTAGSRAYVWTAFPMQQGATSNAYNAVSSSATMLTVNNLSPSGNMTTGLTGAVESLWGSQTLVRSISLTKGIDGNRNTTATGTVYPHVYLDVSVINQGFSNTPFYFPTAQIKSS